MDIQNRYCENCGTEYRFQASGIEDQGFKTTVRHCSECNQVIVEALSKIEKKTKISWIDVFNIPVEDLINHYKNIKGCSPLIRVYPELVNQVNGEISSSQEIRYNGATYFYIYFPSEKNKAIVKKKVRIDCKTGEVIRNEV